MALILRLELRHRLHAVTHGLANRCLTVRLRPTFLVELQGVEPWTSGSEPDAIPFHQSSVLAPCTGFEPANRFRPNAFKAPSSPPGHTAYWSLQAELNRPPSAYRADVLPSELCKHLGDKQRCRSPHGIPVPSVFETALRAV